MPFLFQIFDGRGDCSDLSDECSLTARSQNEVVFSSPYHLIANPILRGLVWLMGISAFVGNIVSCYLI